MICDQLHLASDEARTAAILALLCAGGDDRILPGSDGRNRYFATITPFAGPAYGSSTISSITADALAHLAADWHPHVATPLTPATYAAHLDGLRHRLTALYGDGEAVVVFAASGTDLEYVGLAAAPAGAGPICAILLGRDEVGSGCIHSAAGRFFADRTATGASVGAGTPIDPGHAANRLADLPIRDIEGRPRSSIEIRADIERLADAALAAGEHPVIHIVHGSKTGLTLPSWGDCRALADRYGPRATIVVDACQLRISPAAVRAYLAMGAIVLGTGSKFAGGAPFSGFAFVPAEIMRRAGPLSPGFAKLSRRAEWPAEWPGRDALPDEANPGLLLRLAGALFEFDRFHKLEQVRVEQIIDDFQYAVQSVAAAQNLALLPTDATKTCLAASLVTLDISQQRPHLDFDAASAIHRTLSIGDGTPLRIGQPVRARRLAGGAFAATLRLSLSMPMVADHYALPRAVSQARFAKELAQICATVADIADRRDTQRRAA